MDFDSNRKLIAAALAAAGRGDRKALQTVYRLTAAKLFAVCVRILGERAEAEDVLQEVYMTVWRKAGTFDPALSSPMTWLIAIARNRAIDHLRAHGQNRRMDPIEEAVELADDKPTADAALQSAQEQARLQYCRWSCRPRTRGIARRVLRRQHLRRAYRTHESAARHHEELDP